MQVPDSSTMSSDLRDLTLMDDVAWLAVIDLDRRIGDRQAFDAIAPEHPLADRAPSR